MFRGENKESGYVYLISAVSEQNSESKYMAIWFKELLLFPFVTFFFFFSLTSLKQGKQGRNPGYFCLDPCYSWTLTPEPFLHWSLGVQEIQPADSADPFGTALRVLTRSSTSEILQHFTHVAFGCPPMWTVGCTYHILWRKRKLSTFKV